MNSLARYIEDNGGHDYEFAYSPRILKSRYSASNSSCVWFNDELLFSSRLIEYIKLFQNDDVRVVTSEIYSQTYFLSVNGFYSRNIISKYSDGELHDTVETFYPDGYYCYYRGLEDGRLVVWNDKLYIYGTRWDRKDDKGCICIYELDNNMQPCNEIIVPPQNGGICEKNWGAVEDKPFTFVYCNNPTTVIGVNENGECWLIKKNDEDKTIDYEIKGSTQVVRYDENTYISMVHTNKIYNLNGYKYTDYLTAFVFYDNDLNIIKMSDWFVFKTPMCEFTCGLAIHGDDVYITYSQLDCTSHLLVTNKETINSFINLDCDLNNTCGFVDYYNIAKNNENKKQYKSSFALFNYAATLAGDNKEFSEMKLECLIKMFCGVIKESVKLRTPHYYNEIKECIKEHIPQYPDCCEFYYLLAFVCKITQEFDEMRVYKQLGDERKNNIHKYFFKYFNPNYL